MYRLRPALKVDTLQTIDIGYECILKELQSKATAEKFNSVAMEIYPGVDKTKWKQAIAAYLPNAVVFDTDEAFQSPARIFSQLQPELTDDPVFGRFSHFDFEDFLDAKAVGKLQVAMQRTEGLVILIGVGATSLLAADCVYYLDITRWEVQTRYKNDLADNWRGYKEAGFSEKVKRAYYFEWPAADVVKRVTLPKAQIYIDCTNLTEPKAVSVANYLQMLKAFTSQPFRLVPYFDPGVWGGHWMQQHFHVGVDKVNLAWSFDGVPEENSILAEAQDGHQLETPAQNLVLFEAKALMGNRVFGRYGSDFPIRFDLLDTWEGQNLSLQVHPTLDYAYRKFGAKTTQDESYYILDVNGDDAVVYLGLKDGISKAEVVHALTDAASTGTFDDERYINRIPIKKHDHILIPGGTVHSSGKNSVVLEISQTPNRFTFKLWDWARKDLDGKPRPISLHHGKYVINDQVDADFAKQSLFDHIKVLSDSDGIKREQTGLYDTEAITTQRLTLSAPSLENVEDSVNMLSVVDGEGAIIESVDGSFSPYTVYYAETFIIPEKVKQYRICPLRDGQSIMVLKAFVR